MSDPRSGPDDDLLAAEAALGVLDATERAAVEARAARDPGFTTELDGWTRRFAPMFDDVREATPSTDLWPAIARALEPGVADLAEARTRRDARALTLWRTATATLAAVAAALLVALFGARLGPSPAPTPVMTARLASTAGSPAFVAALDRDGLVLVPLGVATARGRAPELWVIPDGGSPVSLGVGRFDGAVRLRRAAALGAPGRLTLAISVEPPGGSVTGKPTGPVIATGVLRAL